jgi:hypothetical protein
MMNPVHPGSQITNVLGTLTNVFANAGTRLVRSTEAGIAYTTQLYLGVKPIESPEVRSARLNVERAQQVYDQEKTTVEAARFWCFVHGGLIAFSALFILNATFAIPFAMLTSVVCTYFFVHCFHGFLCAQKNLWVAVDGLSLAKAELDQAQKIDRQQKAMSQAAGGQARTHEPPIPPPPA